MNESKTEDLVLTVPDPTYEYFLSPSSDMTLMWTPIIDAWLPTIRHLWEILVVKRDQVDQVDQVYQVY